MDFHKLARRDLQALCKKNQIAANSTNIAMANTLASLQHVEGLDEFLNPVTQSPEIEKTPTPVITQSMTRASTRRRTILKPETEQLPSHTTALFTMRKNEEGGALADGTVNTMEKTRQGKTRPSVTQSTRVYTRRSTRLLMKKMNDLNLSDEVTRDLEPIKMSELAAEKDLTEDLEDAIKDEHPSESIKENSKAEIVACEVEALVEVGSKIEAEGESESEEISKMSETNAAESEVDATPVEVESEGNIPNSQLIANVQGKKSNEVEAPVDVLSEIEEETESHSTEIYGKKEIIAAESDVDAPVEVENDRKEQDSKVIANIQDEKIDEADKSLVGQLQEGLTSVDEAADGYGYAEVTVHVAPANGDDISELTAQVSSMNVNCLKSDCNKDTDSGEVEKTAVPDYNDVMLDGYLADSVVVSESTLKVDSLNGDGELDIHGDALFEQPNNPIANSAAKMELCNNIGQLFDADATEAELAMESPRNQKSAETVDVQIVNGAGEIVKDSNLISAGDSEVELPEEDIFSTKTSASIKTASKVHLSPLSVGRLTELPTPLKSSSKKMQLKDENKENVGEGVEFGKKIITGLPVVDEDIQEPTPLKKKSLGQLKKLVKKKIQMRNDKRLALQMVQENNSMAVAGEKETCTMVQENNSMAVTGEKDD